MEITEFAEMDAVALADGIQKGDFSPAEVYRASLLAIAAVNPALNAVIGFTPEEADRALSSLSGDEAFAGVPMLVKDLGMAVAGVPQQMGSRFIERFVPEADSRLAGLVKGAGLIIVGRTNTPEFGCNLSTEPVLYGPTRNPWDPALSPAGSSGGAAAAVASGMVPVAHANDGGGSIRAPASACGLVGLKPSRGRIPTAPDAEGMVFGLGTEFVVTRSVRDAAGMLAALAVPDPGGRHGLAPPDRPYGHVARTRGPLRIALTTGTSSLPATHPDCVAATQDAARLCESLGHHVEEAAPDVEIAEGIRLWMHFSAVFGARMIEIFERIYGRRAAPEFFERSVYGLFSLGREMPLQRFLDGFDRMNLVTRALARHFARYDVWLTPTMLQPPPSLGVLNADDPDLSTQEVILRWGGWAGFLPLYNVAGMPGISLPLQENGGGVPIGVHFGAGLGREDVLLDLAYDLEAARPWSKRRPLIHVAGCS